MHDVENKTGKARGLEDYFAEPLRRMSKYLQFFQDADQLHLSAADYDYCARLAETMRELNEQASQSLGMNTVTQVMRNIINWPEGVNQFAPERRFIVRYNASSPQGQGDLLLFNDIVLFAKKPVIMIPGLSKRNLQYVHSFPIAGIAVRNVPDDPSRRIIATIELADSTNGNVTLQVSFDCEGTKQAVMSKIQELQGQASVNMLFGVKLENLMQSKSQKGHEIPTIIEETVVVLENRWLTLEGLFRISASKAELTEMRNRLDNGIPVNYNQFNGHSVAGILKFWLRSMPEPLIPFSMYHDFMNCLTGKSPEDGVRTLASLVRRMPPLNRQCLHRIMLMLKQVMEHSSENMMNAGNISIVFSPLLLRDRGRDALPDLSSNTFDTVAAMITNYDTVFGQYVPSSGPRAPAPKKKIVVNPITREESARLNQEFMVFDENGASASMGPASSEAALSLRDIVKQGALMKNREKKQAVWDQRWVVVKKGWLYDFRNQRDTNCIIVPLQAAIVCEHNDPLGKQRFCFVVRPSNIGGMNEGQPEYVFAAKSADEMSQWISAISVCVI